MYEKALQKTSGDESLWGNLGDAYRWLGQPEKARAAYKRAIVFAQMTPDAQTSAGVLGDVGLLYAKMGDSDLAARYTNRARAKSPDDIQLMYSQAQVYVLLGQDSKALAAFRLALAKGYSGPETWNDPENARMQSIPEFAELCRSPAAK